MVNQQDFHRLIRSLEVQDRRSDDLTLRMEDLESLVVLQNFLVGNKLAVNVDSTTVAVGDGHISNDLRVGGGLYVGSLGTDPGADDITADGDITGNKIISSNDVVAGGGLYAGGVGGNPSTGDVWATGDGRFGGGVYIGSLGTNPGANELWAEGNANIQGGLRVGGSSLVTTSGRLITEEDALIKGGLGVGGTTNPAVGTIISTAGAKIGGGIQLKGSPIYDSVAGVEIGWLGSYGRVLSYNRGSSLDQPLYLRGSQIQLQEGATAVLTIDGGDVFTQPFADYYGSSTKTGWSSITIGEIYYKTIGDFVFVTFYIDGTSNSGTTKFTLPYTSKNIANHITQSPCRGRNNGSWVAGALCSINVNSNELIFYQDHGASGWTASGAKTVLGQIFYQRA